MSGFEVVGIILGAYPLLMTALEVYGEVRSGKGALRLLRHLKIEEAIFNNFIHHLLAPPLISEAELIRLTDPTCPDLDLWKDSTLQARLRARLGHENASIAVEILGELNELLRLLRNDLSTNDGGGTTILRRFRSSLRTARHALPHSSVREHLIRLKDLNSDLERLLADRSYISSVTYRRSTPSLKKYLRRDTSCADDIYDAIYHGYRCNCNVAHLANFGFPKVSESFGSDDHDLIQGENFELLFPVDGSELSDTVSSLTLGSKTLTDDAVGCKARRISISESNGHKRGEEHEPIRDLCGLLKTLDGTKHVADTRLGILQLRGKQYELQSPVYLHDLANSQNIVCLDHYLAGQRFGLSRKERMDLALRMSYAILQFYASPWIEASWTWRDFCIDKQNDSQLFVTRKFYSSRSRDSTPMSEKPSMLKFSDIVEEPILTKLGIALIELAIGKRLAELRAEDQPPTLDSELLDFSTAKKLITSGQILREEGRGYEEVVKACLFHQFSCDSQFNCIDSSQPTFQNAVERSIIEPLHKIWSVTWGA